MERKGWPGKEICQRQKHVGGIEKKKQTERREISTF